jgi:phosphoenolpyruvate---glycerone phosphotransferase subunit DhaK
VGKPMFQLGEEEMELGIGVHGERGVERTKLRPADEIASVLFDRVSSDLGLKHGNEIVLLVNGMGATPQMELLIFSRRVVQLLEKAGAKIFRSVVGSFVTSLDMAGVSLTLLRVDEEMKQMLLAPEATPSFPKIV